MRFTFSRLPISSPTGGAAGKAGKSLDENTLERSVGFEFASNQLPDDLLFSRMGGWSPLIRASVVRVVMFKMAGIGVAAALMSANPWVGKYGSASCAMAAAVNLIAATVYWHVWQIRAQVWRTPAYQKLMSTVGRADASEEEAEQMRDKNLIHIQETLVDGLRETDWVVTLPILSLELGHQREFMHLASKGAIAAMPIAKEWVAALQALMVLCATVYRFYTNEGRTTRGLTILISWASFAAASGVFGVVVWAQLSGLPASSAVSEPSLKSDIFAMQLLTLVWIGYPAVSLVARAAHIGVPGDEYLASVSLFKDIAYALLDVTSKAGLAFYVVLHATWVDAAEEARLLATNTSIGNFRSVGRTEHMI